MPRFAANLSFLFGEREFLDRFAAAADLGFRAVEYLFPYEWPAADLARRLREAGLEQALFNLPPGDWGRGERGLACLPGREDEFRAGADRAIAYARELGCARLHAMAGLMPPGVDEAALARTYRDNIAWLADRAAPHRIGICLEPINRRDIPGYFLASTDRALAVLDEIGRPNAWLQHDLYHAQIVHGDLAKTIERVLPRIGHVQIANPPGRNEPERGEIDYVFLFDLLDRLGYAGWIGCEYKPSSDTRTSLRWAKPYGIG